MDDQLLKSHLRTIYSQLRSQQEAIGNLTRAQNAFHETLKLLNPSFAGTYENEAAGVERGAEQVDNERLLELIDAQIQALQEGRT
jgi:hypothetical protein